VDVPVSANPSLRIIRFSTFKVNLDTGELRQDGQKVRLQEQPFQVLAALLERPGEVVTREELRSKLWPVDGRPAPRGTDAAGAARGGWKRTVMMAVAGCLVVAGLLYAWMKPNRERLPRLVELQRLTAVPLTALPGTALSPTFSPDGSQIAFAWDGGDIGKGYDLYVKVIGADEPLRLTVSSIGETVRGLVTRRPQDRNIARSGRR